MLASAHTNMSSELADIGRRIAAQFEITLGNSAVVDELCKELLQHLHHPPLPADALILEDLVPHLRIRTGPIANSLFSVVEPFVDECGSPWALLQNMLHSRDDSLVPRALNALLGCVRQGKISDASSILELLAKRCDEPDGVCQQSAALSIIGEILACLAVPVQAGNATGAESLYRSADHDNVRRLAARVLDMNGRLPPPALSVALLGPAAFAFLSPYLDFTRATHLDVLRLAVAMRDGSSVVNELRAAQDVCGPDMLRQVIAELGWSRLNNGIHVRRCIGVSVTGSLPLMLSPEEVVLFQSCGDTQCVSEAYLAIGHGSMDGGSTSTGGGSERIDRYRRYNLTHAELLDLILRVEPLSRDRVLQIVERMDRVVDDFGVLFSSQSAECTILREVYLGLKAKIMAELSGNDDSPQLSAELTRLVQMFEEPRSLGTVRTLHGLKRYLHQQGLRLSFGLIETGRQLSHMVDVLTITPDGRRLRAHTIRYADFEPEASATPPNGALPYAVAVVAEGFGRQMLYGQEHYPGVDIFCYGNEVHYYLSYRNHPAFLRIDYSPPLRGGMIDLEYYGVSNYELGVHPNIALDAVQLFFRELGFDVQLSGTRIHARCDKESIGDLGMLCEKVEALFRLVPYLMDIDWIIGSLALSPEARRKVTEAWAESFALWGVLPISQLLTADRNGILETIVADPAGPHEVAWSGHGDYRDALTISPPLGFFERLSRRLEALELETLPLYAEDSRRPMGQVRLEQRLFAPLRSAVRRGELVADQRGFHRLPQSLFESEHEANRFAELIAEGVDRMTQAVIIARVITPLERMLRFTTTGSVNECEIQRAYLPLRGGRYVLYVLRDTNGAIRMAAFSPDGPLCRRRRAESEDWITNWRCDVQELSGELRRNSYFVAGPELSLAQARQEATELLREFLKAKPRRRALPVADERVLRGLSASPGRVTGPVRFGTENRSPEDLAGAVLLADILRPDDNAYLYRCAGVMTTGGGVLSHAGLMAMQFSKPAMIIPGRWQRERDGSRSVLYLIEEFAEELSEPHGLRVSIRHHVRQRECIMREGDLVVLDATRAVVTVLGQNRDVVSLCDELRQFGTESRALSAVRNDSERLRLQGRKMRARYMMEKILSRLTDPVIERFAVHELLLGTMPSTPAMARSEPEELLSTLMRNPHVGEDARLYALWIMDELAQRFDRAWSKASVRIPISSSLYEILTRRRDIRRLHALLSTTAASLRTCGVLIAAPDPEPLSTADTMAKHRLRAMHDDLHHQLWHEAGVSLPDRQQRHRLRRLQQLEDLLGAHPHECSERAPTWPREAPPISAHIRSRRVLMSHEGGLGCAELIGWKAANLAEIENVFGADIVPPWFVVTDAAFQELLLAPMSQLAPGRSTENSGNITLREAIAQALSRSDLTNLAKSQLIRALWDGITLPSSLVDEILTAYHQIEMATHAKQSELYVALRSSSREEDAEVAVRAGEFETFLYVRGDQPLLEYLKRTWGSLWTERALHNRAVLGVGSDAPGGGVIVQRIVPSRVSGVALTVNVANDEPGEMVINAGYGLGEGVVSGRVAADQVTVLKEQDTRSAPLRFKYVISDKREQVVFNERTGAGTIMTTTLYHQRLRPALEYIELKELVSLATRFEEVYGYPLDIEFAFEETRLWILQVRPVATFAAIIQETLQQYPLAAATERLVNHHA